MIDSQHVGQAWHLFGVKNNDTKPTLLIAFLNRYKQSYRGVL